MKSATPIILILWILSSCTEEKNNAIGQKSTTFVDASRKRPIATEIWYPTRDNLPNKAPKEKQKALFKTILTIPDAKIPHEKHPLLIISHGTGGNRFSLTWFIARMVKEGYIVISLDHYGNSTFNKIPREFVKWWERAIDIQYVLTQILKDKEIGTKIDTSRIGGVGFSLGGYTNIALAGGYVDRTMRENAHEMHRKLPPEFPETQEVIDFQNDSLVLASYSKYKSQVKDDRFKAFFVMAPGIGFGFHSKEQTAKITQPVFIVAGKGDMETPVVSNAANYHRLIKTSKIHLFNEHVGHYVFLNEPTEYGKEVAPNITIDNPSVDRNKIHEETLKLAVDFFESTLSNQSKTQ